MNDSLAAETCTAHPVFPCLPLLWAHRYDARDLACCQYRGVLTAPDLAAYSEAQVYEHTYAPSTHDSYLPEPTGISVPDLSTHNVVNRQVASLLALPLRMLEAATRAQTSLILRISRCGCCVRAVSGLQDACADSFLCAAGIP